MFNTVLRGRLAVTHERIFATGDLPTIFYGSYLTKTSLTQIQTLDFLHPVSPVVLTWNGSVDETRFSPHHVLTVPQPLFLSRF
ncbi:hypothetical protein PM082_009667 [Marasmius tenuissimus]|nr:hypothetical protein PM082_009667 [Marasmius tenuissimus]